jgi:hypothetical protein
VTGVKLPVLDLDPEVDPWERQQPGETPRRFSQFCVYRDAGRGRTLRKAAETLTRHPVYVRAISTAYRWVERAEAWDRHRDAQHDKVWLDARRDAAARDAVLLNSAARTVADRVATLDPAELAPHELIRLLDVVLKHRRALYGDPAATIALTGPGGDPLTVQLADLAGMDTAQRRAATLQLAEVVRRRAAALSGRADDDD